MIYILDTNAVSDFIVNNANFVRQVEQHIANRDRIILCQPVYYELVRGLVWRGTQKKISILRNRILPHFEWVPLDDIDWVQAALFWSQAVSAGKQLSDIDLLIAALANRLDAVIVTADDDFDALPVKRDNWRLSSEERGNAP